MKITDRSETAAYADTIKKGECAKHDEQMLMRTSKLTPDVVSFVNLQTGDFVQLPPTTLVIPLDGEVIVTLA